MSPKPNHRTPPSECRRSPATPSPDRENGSQLPFSEQEREKLRALPDEELTAIANGSHPQFLGGMRRAIKDHARVSGAALLVIRDRIGHGCWIEWLRDNFKGSVETAKVYMRIAKNWPAIVEHLGENATLEGMRSFLSLPKEQQGSPKPDQPKSQQPPELDVNDDGTAESVAPTPPRPQAIEKIEIFLDADDDGLKEMVSYPMEDVFKTANVSDTCRRAIEFCYEEKYHDENNPSRKHAV